MNREEFVDIFSQNVHVSGGNRRFFAELTYTGKESSSLVPDSFGSRILTIPAGEGFRILMSRNTNLISGKQKAGKPMPVRATRKAFRNIRDMAVKNGFRLFDIILSRAGKNIVNVSGEPDLASEIYEKYSAEQLSFPDYMGFRREGCEISFSMDMKVVCQNYIREAGGLIFDSIQGILSESSIYGELYHSFSPKYDDFLSAKINPVTINGNFGERDEVLNRLEKSLPLGLDIKPAGNSGIYFSHSSGLWGEISCLKDSIMVYFMTVADFNLGIELIDTLKELVHN